MASTAIATRRTTSPLREEVRARAQPGRVGERRRAGRMRAHAEDKCGGTRREIIGGAASLLVASSSLGPQVASAEAAAGKSLYDLSASMYGEEVPLSKFAGQFGGQAPGTSQEEREFAWKKFGLSGDALPVFDKVDVNGPFAHPVYQLLRSQQPSSVPAAGTRALRKGDIEWNYTKFLVNRQGQAVKRFKPSFDPLDFETDLKLILAGKDPLPEECIMHPGRSVCNPKL